MASGAFNVVASILVVGNIIVAAIPFSARHWNTFCGTA